MYVLCFEAKDTSRDPMAPRPLETVRTSVRFPGETMILVTKGSDHVLVAKIQYVAGGRIL